MRVPCAPIIVSRRTRCWICLAQGRLGKCAFTLTCVFFTASKVIRGGWPEGMYDKMGALGAHEVVIETPHHEAHVAVQRRRNRAVLSAWATRIIDLKKDLRFKYVTVFKNQGGAAGDEYSPRAFANHRDDFVPRRIKYELSSASEWFRERERCIFCESCARMKKNGKRIVDVQGDYYALCPYASRVPFEIWVLTPQTQSSFRAAAARLKSPPTRRIARPRLAPSQKVAPAFHMVVHIAPNTRSKKGELRRILENAADDFHWHIEILPILEKRSKSYSIKEVYFNAMLPETRRRATAAMDPNS